MKKTSMVIIGGGVAGLTAAIALQRIGITALIYERANELRGIGAGFGLAANAMQALEILGLRESVEQIGHFLPSYNILDQHGRILARPNTQKIGQHYQQKNFALHRGDLHSFLLSQISDEQLHLGRQAVRLERKENSTIVYFSNGETIQTKGLIIADGIRSKLREQLLPNAIPRYAGYTCWRAIINNADIALGTSTETWGRNGRFGMTPLIGNKVYWYACINGPQNSPEFANYKINDLRRHFANYHSPIPDILEKTSSEQLIWSDIMDIKPLDSLAHGNILLIGDAGHATTPNLGQGACQAIEDVAVLFDELQKTNDIAVAFTHVSQRRLRRTRYITNTSWRIGKVAQWENTSLIGIRNFCMRIIPESIKQFQLDKLLNEDFMSIK